MSSQIACVKNTFITIASEDEVRGVNQRLTPSKTIDIGCLMESEAFKCESPKMQVLFMSRPVRKTSADTDSTGCCTSLSTLSVADSEGLKANEAERKAVEHACGECKPCVFSTKAGGCQNDECGFCHEEHDKEFLRFIKKRNRALRMAQLHGDAPRCAETYQEYSQERRHSC